MITKSDTGPQGWQFWASKKVDDISKHGSLQVPKQDSKQKPEAGDGSGDEKRQELETVH